MPKGYNPTKEHKRKISETLKGRHPVNEFKKGYIVSKKTRRKMSETALNMSNEHKKKISNGHKGINHSENTKKKMRISAFEYAKRICGIICPRIGHNEKKILDKLELELGYKIVRQYKIEGYFIDGYIPELNIAIEVDEIPKDKERDIERQKIIENKLGCKFIRINDYD